MNDKALSSHLCQSIPSLIPKSAWQVCSYLLWSQNHALMSGHTAQPDAQFLVLLTRSGLGHGCRRLPSPQATGLTIFKLIAGFMLPSQNISCCTETSTAYTVIVKAEATSNVTVTYYARCFYDQFSATKEQLNVKKEANLHPAYCMLLVCDKRNLNCIDFWKLQRQTIRRHSQICV